jgi:hypothetical protein
MLEHWCHHINKCCNIGPQGLQIGLPNLMVSFLQPWGSIQGHNDQHLLVTWGKLKSFYLILKPLGTDFNFCTNRNAGFGLYKISFPVKHLMSNYAETGCFNLSYAFDALLCWNWPFSVHNRLTLRITFNGHCIFTKRACGFEQTHSWDRPKRTCPLGLKRGRKGHMKTTMCQ